jgi:S-formylglutathione hydrolase FrmB
MFTSPRRLFTGAGFYLDATNPKYALHYNMRTHIQLEIPQVLEITGLPIVNSDISFSPL